MSLFFRPKERTQFFKPGPLRDGELELILRRRSQGDPDRGLAPSYQFAMMHYYSNKHMGNIDLRLGDSEDLTCFVGQVGYRVYPNYRGCGYAGRALKLILPLAQMHDMDPLWITCSPENIASRKTLQRAGGKYLRTVQVPADNPLYLHGQVEKCIFRFDLDELV